jgi:hypothetical protein
LWRSEFVIKNSRFQAEFALFNLSTLFYKSQEVVTFTPKYGIFPRIGPVVSMVKHSSPKGRFPVRVWAGPQERSDEDTEQANCFACFQTRKPESYFDTDQNGREYFFNKKPPFGGFLLFLSFFMRSILFAPFAELLELDLSLNFLFVLSAPIVCALALGTYEFYQSFL